MTHEGTCQVLAAAVEDLARELGSRKASGEKYPSDRVMDAKRGLSELRAALESEKPLAEVDAWIPTRDIALPLEKDWWNLCFTEEEYEGEGGWIEEQVAVHLVVYERKPDGTTHD